MIVDTTDHVGLRQAQAPRRGPDSFPAPLAGLCRADQYDMQKKSWQALTQQWRAEVSVSLSQARATVERHKQASQALREEILAVVQRVAEPRSLAVSDFPVLVKEWADPDDTSKVGARDGQQRLWRCTVDSAHGTWSAPTKDRSRADRPSMCPKCSGTARAGQLPAFERSLAAIPALASELHPRSGSPTAISYGSNTTVHWWHRVPAARPGSGEWYLATHEWQQPPKSRTSLRDSGGVQVGINGCPVCNADRADSSNSLASWYPELAEQWVSGSKDRTAQDTPVGSKMSADLLRVPVRPG